MAIKELSLCHKLEFNDSQVFATDCKNHFLPQIKLKAFSKTFTSLFHLTESKVYKVIGIKKLRVCVKTQFLCSLIVNLVLFCALRIFYYFYST